MSRIKVSTYLIATMAVSTPVQAEDQGQGDNQFDAVQRHQMLHALYGCYHAHDGVIDIDKSEACKEAVKSFKESVNRKQGDNQSRVQTQLDDASSLFRSGSAR